MEEMEVEENLRDRIMEIYVTTSVNVKVGDEISREFYTMRGVRQGCPLSSFREVGE